MESVLPNCSCWFVSLPWCLQAEPGGSPGTHNWSTGFLIEMILGYCSSVFPVNREQTVKLWQLIISNECTVCLNYIFMFINFVNTMKVFISVKSVFRYVWKAFLCSAHAKTRINVSLVLDYGLKLLVLTPAKVCAFWFWDFQKSKCHGYIFMQETDAKERYFEDIKSFLPRDLSCSWQEASQKDSLTGNFQRKLHTGDSLIPSEHLT